MGDRRYSDVLPTKEQYEMFAERLDEGIHPLDWLWQHVAPDMAERRRARTCALLAIASPADRNGFRGRSHLLLYDDQTGGTGKSALAGWIKRTVPDALGCGPDSSEAGLKYNANLGQPGKLAQAHGGILRIEEFEKFDRTDRQATFEAMSEGAFEVDKGGINTEFPAATRVVAVCNDIGVLSDPLRTRFDFRLEMDAYDEDETVTIAAKRQGAFRERFVLGNAGDDGPPLVPAYIAWCADHDPGFPAESDARIKELTERLVREGGQVGEIRRKEGLLRVAYTIAKLRRGDIQPRDWVRAVDLTHPHVDAADLFADVLEG